MPAWRVYYGDGSFFGSDQGDPLEAPPVDVIAVVQQDIDKDGRRFWSLLAGTPDVAAHHFDWYWRCDPDGRGEFWWAGTLDGFMDQAMRLGAHSPKQGRTVHNDTYQRVLDAAIAGKAELER